MGDQIMCEGGDQVEKNVAEDAKLPDAAEPEKSGSTPFSPAASWSVSAARRRVQIGRQSREWVMLRCQVSISSSLWEKKCGDVGVWENRAGRERPGDDATLGDGSYGKEIVACKCRFGMSAPAIPCVMVSMRA